MRAASVIAFPSRGLARSTSRQRKSQRYSPSDVQTFLGPSRTGCQDLKRYVEPPINDYQSDPVDYRSNLSSGSCSSPPGITDGRRLREGRQSVVVRPLQRYFSRNCHTEPWFKPLWPTSLAWSPHPNSCIGLLGEHHVEAGWRRIAATPLAMDVQDAFIGGKCKGHLGTVVARGTDTAVCRRQRS